MMSSAWKLQVKQACLSALDVSTASSTSSASRDSRAARSLSSVMCFSLRMICVFGAGPQTQDLGDFEGFAEKVVMGIFSRGRRDSRKIEKEFAGRLANDSLARGGVFSRIQDESARGPDRRHNGGQRFGRNAFAAEVSYFEIPFEEGPLQTIRVRAVHEEKAWKVAVPLA